MASWWNSLRSEVMGTVEEMREKGVVGTFKDAALDVADLAKGAASAVTQQVQGLAGSSEGEELAVVRSETVPARGATVMLELPSGDVVSATVVDVDGISEPPRVTVSVEGEEEQRLALVLAPGAAIPDSGETGLLDGVKQEWSATVQEFREKGAFGAVKDAALDTADLLGGAAKAVGQGAASLAGPLLDGGASPSASRGAEEAADREGEAEGDAEGSRSEDIEPSPSLLESVRQEMTATVQDIRENAAVGAVTNATREAVGLVSTTAKSVGSGAVSLAKPLIDLDAPLQKGAEGAAAGAAWLKEGWSSTVQDMREKGAVEAMKGRAAGVAEGARSVVERASTLPEQLFGPAASAADPGDAGDAAPAATATGAGGEDAWLSGAPAVAPAPAAAAAAAAVPAAAAPAEATQAAEAAGAAFVPPPRVAADKAAAKDSGSAAAEPNEAEELLD